MTMPRRLFRWTKDYQNGRIGSSLSTNSEVEMLVARRFSWLLKLHLSPTSWTPLYRAVTKSVPVDCVPV